MTTRLLALVFVPLLGLLIIAGSLTRVRLETATAASVIEQQVDRVARLVNAQSALHAENIPVEAMMQIPGVGVDRAAANKLLGFDIDQRLRDSVAATNRMVDLLQEDRDLVPLGVLDGLRTGAANGSADPAVVRKQYQLIDEALLNAVNETVAGIDARIGQMVGGSQVDGAMDAIRVTTDLTQAVTRQLDGLEGVFLGRDPQRSLLDLAGAAARAQIATGALDRVNGPEVADEWRNLRATEPIQLFDRSVRETLDGRTLRFDGTAESLERMASIARSGLQYNDRLDVLTHTATEAVRRVASDLRAEAIAEERQWLAFAGTLFAASIIVSILFARTITRPLRRLADHAAAVGAGDLEVGALVRSCGPRDLATTFEAFDDLVANLRLMEAKSQALAACDFDADVLAEPLPGELGRSLQESVRVLSGSIIERDLLQQHVAHQASHDSLTGLHNRSAANDALYLALMRCRRNRTGLAVLFVDLDDFKRANDTYGHGVGDRLLQEVGDRMHTVVGDGVFLARLGADEFMVVIEDIDDVGQVTTVARSLVTSIRRPMEIDAMHLSILASVGIAFAWDGSEQPDQLLAWADLAVTRAKQHGRGTVEIYDESLQRQLLERAEIEEALTAALPLDELFLQYQPVTDLITGQLSGVEALVRWQRPGFGIQPPDSFIPVAERTDLIIDLDRWVMARAARQIGDWKDLATLADIDVAINVSGRHLVSETLCAHVIDLLTVTGINPHNLIIEITETVLVNDLENAATQLEEIRTLGVRIALDDFGTGYTSITHLQQLPVDIIKIDRSFIERLGNEKDRKLLAMITDLGHHLGMTITAEGVETVEQLEVLRELGCDRAQGFLLSRPLNVVDLEARMASSLSLLPASA